MFEGLQIKPQLDPITPGQYYVPYGAQIRRMLLDHNLSGQDYGLDGLKAMELDGDERILVVGSGDAFAEVRLRTELAHQGPIVAMEIPSDDFEFQARFYPAEEQLRKAKLPGFDKVQGLVESIPFEDDSFDAIIVDHVIYHSIEPRQAYMEMGRVGRPDAKILIRSNGRNNKKKHHHQLRAMGRLAGVAAPMPFSTYHNMQTLKVEALKHFNLLNPVEQHDYMVITEDERDLYLSSIDSYRASFETLISAKLWKEIRSQVAEKEIDDAINATGAYYDSIERGGAVYINNKLSFSRSLGRLARQFLRKA